MRILDAYGVTENRREALSLSPTPMTPELWQYLRDICVRESPALQELRQITHTTLGPRSEMQVSPEQGQFMAFLAQVIGAKYILELGTFTGYTTLCLAQSLPDDGHIITCDINEHVTHIAQQQWQKAEVAHKITLHLKPAQQVLDILLSSAAGQFDMVFLDADQKNIEIYYERSLGLLRTHGLILIDNAFWKGTLLYDEGLDDQAVGMYRLNEKLRHSKDISFTMVPLSDGLTIVRKI